MYLGIGIASWNHGLHQALRNWQHTQNDMLQRNVIINKRLLEEKLCKLMIANDGRSLRELLFQKKRSGMFGDGGECHPGKVATNWISRENSFARMLSCGM